MATRKALNAEDIVASVQQAYPGLSALESRHVADEVLAKAARHFRAQERLDALAALIRSYIPRWLRRLLPVEAIARAVARFVAQSLDPNAADPAPDA